MQDPYVADSTAAESSIDWQTWPNVEYPDIYIYIISYVYKSMEGYKFYVHGWVSEIVLPIPCTLKANLICAKVKHS